MSEEKRMVESYEIKEAVQVGRKQIIFAEDKTKELPYLCCDCTWNNPFGADTFDNGAISDDYMLIMREFTRRIDAELRAISRERRERNISNVPLTDADCIKGSKHGHLEGQIVVVDPDKMTPAVRTADHQLFLATGGNGCKPGGLGNAVFCTNLYSGEQMRWERYEIAGVIQPERMPEWAKEKLAALEEKPSLRDKLEKGKQAAKEQPARDDKKPPAKNGPEL